MAHRLDRGGDMKAEFEKPIVAPTFNYLLDIIRMKIKNLEFDRSCMLDDDLPDWEASENGYQLEVLEEMLKVGEKYYE